MSQKYIALALFALGTLAACEKKEPAPTEVTEPPSVTTPAAAPVAAAAPAPVDVDTLSVEEEFEAEAEKDLTSANLTAKLDELEKEISAP